MKFTIPLRKLSDLDVKFVSLVDRGANRIPFRIIKSQEKDMSLDLSKMGFRVKKAASEHAKAQTAKVSAIILSSGDDAVVAKVRTLLAQHGIDLTEQTHFEDGTVALHKEDSAFMDGGTIVRMSDSMAVVLVDMGDHLSNLKKSAFGEIAETNGYFDGPNLIMATANALVKEGVQKADSPEATATLIRDSMEGVQQYLGFLTMALPSSVLKVEEAVGEIVNGEPTPAKKKVAPSVKEVPVEAEDCSTEIEETPAPKKKKVPVVAEDTEELEEVEPVEASKKKKVPVVAEDTEETEEVVATKTKKVPVVAEEVEEAEEVEAPKKKKVPVEAEEGTPPSENKEQMEKVLKAMSDMAFAVATLTKNVGTLSADIASIKKTTEEKIDVLTKKAETATHAVRGTVLTSNLPSDPQPFAKIKKVDTDPRTGVFDSAMLSRTR